MPQTKVQHKLYMRERRLRKQDKRNEIDRHLDEQVKRVNQQPQKDEKDKQEIMGANIFGDSVSEPQPKQPLQAKFKDLFPEFSE